MTREEFETEVAKRIEYAIMRAQGIGDGPREETPEEIAHGIALLVPYDFSALDEE